MKNEKFYKLIIGMLGFMHSYNFCLLTNETKDTGYFLCVSDKYNCLYIPKSMQLVDFLNNLFPTALDVYIEKHRELVESPTVFIIITYKNNMIMMDIARHITDKKEALDIVSKTTYYYGVVDIDGHLIN